MHTSGRKKQQLKYETHLIFYGFLHSLVQIQLRNKLELFFSRDFSSLIFMTKNPIFIWLAEKGWKIFFVAKVSVVEYNRPPPFESGVSKHLLEV